MTYRYHIGKGSLRRRKVKAIITSGVCEDGMSHVTIMENDGEKYPIAVVYLNHKDDELALKIGKDMIMRYEFNQQIQEFDNLPIP